MTQKDKRREYALRLNGTGKRLMGTKRMAESGFRKLTMEDLPNVRDLLEKVLTQPPWNDD